MRIRKSKPQPLSMFRKEKKTNEKKKQKVPNQEAKDVEG